MYIAIYSIGIVLVCTGIVLFFVLKHRRDKKILHKLKTEEKDTASKDGIVETTLEKELSDKPIEKEMPSTIEENPVFEDFSLDFESMKDMKTEKEFPKRDFVNPFDFEDDEEEVDEDDDDFMDEKFAEYENFLKKNIDFEDDDDWTNEEEDDDLNAVKNFDFESIKGKDESEIREIIKSLPPKAQEILLGDILARKNFDDKED